MSTDFKIFPDVFKDVVTEVRARYDLTNGVQPYFGFGTYEDLREYVKVKDNNQIEKYPLVWLLWNGDNVAKWFDPCGYNLSVSAVICDMADQDKSTEERYTNLKAILYPISDLLIDELQYSIHIDSGFNYSVIDHPFASNNMDGSFDILSAIEIKLENLLIYQ